MKTQTAITTRQAPQAPQRPICGTKSDLTGNDRYSHARHRIPISTGMGDGNAEFPIHHTKSATGHRPT